MSIFHKEPVRRKELDGGNEVICSEVPYDDLPRELVIALEDIALMPGWNLAVDVQSSIEKMIEEWDELHSDQEFLTWLDNQSGKPVVFLTDDRGALQRAFEGTSEDMLPTEFVDLMIEMFKVKDLDGRIKAIEAIRKIVDEWGCLAVMPEKMIGHLFLCHGFIEVPEIETDEDEEEFEVLWRIHSGLHKDLRKLSISQMRSNSGY